MTDLTPTELIAEAERLVAFLGETDGGPVIRQLLAETARLQAVIDDLTKNPRDAYHSMDELYDYRMLYNALAFNGWAAHGTHPVVKSWRHSDGDLCFGGGWFIVTATLPTGLVSNHYKAEHWDLFQVPEATPPEYDGHTPAVAAQRMRDLLAAAGSSSALEAVKADTTTEWGVRYKNLDDEPVYISHGDEDPRASCEAALVEGDVLVSRQATEWVPVETEGERRG